MGKKGGTSWLTAVKRAFRSPTRDAVKKNSRFKVEHEHDEEEEKKREKRRWLFRKASTTAAAAEAAVATAQAAVEIMRLTRPYNSLKQHQAATVIQTSFRGFLAKRALIALRGIVKLQALIRGQNVRKQAKMTLKCMQALLKVQARLRDQRARLSHDGGRRSMFAETTNIWESKYLQDIRERKSTCRDGSTSIGNEWSECPHTLEELEAILEARKEASFRRERTLASAFSQQLWDDNEVVEERPSWLEKGANTTSQWDTISRGSTDKRDSIKTVEIDTLKRYSSHLSPSISRKSHYSSPHYKQTPQHIIASPRQRTQNYFSPTLQPPLTPLPSKARPTHTRPASPRCSERSYSTVNTPSLRSLSRGRAGETANAAVPNYMAATESAKAKTRSQSAPRSRPSSRPSTPERDIRGGVARKKLSYPVPEHVAYGYNNLGYKNLRSPSFKSVQAGYVGMEQQSNFSFNTDSIGGELSPCSTTDLRRFLRK
ncbi:hypothetical protein LIER_12159 [Lithospermum erythrorhizon]|uniref:DUF4005 domain-containing protein n=1 Tax=Lithospermum erythrorhizon TaxID=34254 RepID=A0AAV3PQP8_LITER